LGQITYVDENGAWDGWSGFEVACVEGVDLKAAGGVLEEEGTEAEVCVGTYTGVAGLFDLRAGDGWVV